MRILIVGIFTVILSSGPSAFAQDEAPAPADAAETPVEAAKGPGPSEAPAGDRSAEIDALEPGVPTQVLTAENRRPAPAQAAMDELDLGTSEITGNQELPKVLYIVPWRKSDPGDLMGQPANTLLDEVLAPVDRNEFAREVDYYRDLFDETEAQ